MSPGQHAHYPQTARFPRVSGDEPAMMANLPGSGMFSPRERG